MRLDIKVVVVFEKEYHAYQGTLAATIRILRPDAEVVVAEPEKLRAVARRFGPDIVIGSQFEDGDLDGVPAWIKLSLDPVKLSEVSVDGQYSRVINPTLDSLLAIIEEAASLGRTGPSKATSRPPEG